MAKMLIVHSTIWDIERLLRNTQIRNRDAENFGLLVTFGAITPNIGSQSAEIQGSRRDNS